MTKHVPVGQETLDTMTHKQPSVMLMGGKQYLSFKDIFYNLLLNQLQHVDFDEVNKKVETLTTQPMSRKHRERLKRQLKRKIGLKEK